MARRERLSQSNYGDNGKRNKEEKQIDRPAESAKTKVQDARWNALLLQRDIVREVKSPFYYLSNMFNGYCLEEKRRVIAFKF